MSNDIIDTSQETIGEAIDRHNKVSKFRGAPPKTQCIVCGKLTSSSGILLPKSIAIQQAQAPKITGLCTHHQNVVDKGYVILVGINKELSAVTSDGSIDRNSAVRTGLSAEVPSLMFTQIFEIPVPEGRVVFVGDDVVHNIAKLIGVIEAKRS